MSPPLSSKCWTTTTRKYGGTGLGLAICDRLVKAMGGSIQVSSIPKEGSCFRFSIQVQPVRRSAAPVQPVIQVPRSEISLRLLVAEDNRVNQILIARLLGRLGHKVKIVENGKLAIEEIQVSPYDAVLMDMQMPEMDGPTATRIIRELGGKFAKIPVIALTADAMQEHHQSFLQAGLPSMSLSLHCWIFS